MFCEGVTELLLHGCFIIIFQHYHIPNTLESNTKSIVTRIATPADYKYAESIANEMAYSAAKRGTGIANRTPEYILNKMQDGQAVIAIDTENDTWAGFSCMEVWEHEKYVAKSGLIVAPDYRGIGISKSIKTTLFELCRTKFPRAKLFSLSTSPAVMHINLELGYRIVPNEEILQDELFLQGCTSWVNYVELMNKQYTELPYVAMVYDPSKEATLSVVPAMVNPDVKQEAIICDASFSEVNLGAVAAI